VTSPALLTTDSLRKSYGGVRALRGASLDVHAGEVHALLGENGTGKSTLMRILAGVERADDGVISLDGEQVAFRDAAEARAAGISIVFQELSLFPDLDVLANLFMGRQPTRAGRVDRRAMRARAAPVVRRLGLTFPLDTLVARLTLAERQLVEICKALIGDARVLILDEPNSALNSHESARLFQLIDELRNSNTALIYISHRLEEVFAIADRISVMRNGKIIQTDVTDNLSIPSVVEAMLGRKANSTPKGASSQRAAAPVAVRLDRINAEGRLRDVCLDVHEGEVLGLAGLEGAGQQEVLRAIFGDLAIDSGGMQLAGRPWAPRSPRDAARAQVGFVPADRTRAGLMMSRSIGDNIAAVRMASTKDSTYRQHDLHRRAGQRVTDMQIRASSTHLPVSSLSGGNQQKVVLAKWLEVHPRVLLLDDPTRGVDVGGKAEIYDLIGSLTADGVTVVFTSSELIEYQAVCHRVLVLSSGRVVQEIPIADATEHELAEAINAGSTTAPAGRHLVPNLAADLSDQHQGVQP